MFWDHAAGLYDFFMTLKNGKVNRKLCLMVADLMDPKDRVLECACGTGMISVYIAERCASLTATDFSAGMLKETRKKCRRFSNVTVEQADILKLSYADSSFDKAVAANVIHLLSEPETALRELERVVKPGGSIIIPTYVNVERNGKPNLFVRLVGKLGAGFQAQFTYESYQAFFKALGYQARFELITGRMPCAVAVITRKRDQ